MQFIGLKIQLLYIFIVKNGQIFNYIKNIYFICICLIYINNNIYESIYYITEKRNGGIIKKNTKYLYMYVYVDI